MSQRLLQHLETAQYGFRKNYHINDAIFNLLNNITNLLDQRKHVGGIFCDLTKAFDCVNHETLLTKLYYYGVKGLCLSWFKSVMGKLFKEGAKGKEKNFRRANIIY